MIISASQMRMLVMSIILTMFAYGTLSFWTGFDAIIQSFQTIGFHGVIIIFGLSLFNYFFRFMRWHLYINVTNRNAVPILQHIIIYLSGFALTTTPAKAGETIRGVFLRKYGIDFKTNIACFISERLSDLLAIVILCLLGVTYYYHYTKAFVTGVVLVGVLFGFILYPSMIIRIRNFCHTMPKTYKILDQIYDILLRIKIYHTPNILCQSLIISVIAWGFEACGFYYMIQILGYDINIFQAVFIYAISMLIGGISFIPGGLGSSEAVMITLLISHNIPLATATAMTIFIRIATLWFAVIIGLCCLIVQSYQKKNDIKT